MLMLGVLQMMRMITMIGELGYGWTGRSVWLLRLRVW